MNKTYILFILLVLATCISCGETACNECLELSTKNVRYVDANGNNLLFGDQAIYDPANVIIRSENEINGGAWPGEDSQTLWFNLQETSTTYYITTPDSLIDTLQFNFAKRKSTRCCGDVVYSTQTRLNGREIDNGDLITIIR